MNCAETGDTPFRINREEPYMKDDQKLHIWERALILALSVTLLLGAWLPGPRVAGWWCVMFPPLYPAGAAETMAQDDERAGDYEIRFRIVELWEMVCETAESLTERN